MKVADLQRHIPIYPLEPGKGAAKTGQSGVTGQPPPANAKPFAEILQEKIGNQQSLRFSAHAIRRLEERSVRLSENELTRLNQGVQQLDEKGSKNSLVLIDDTAYIVSVKNKIVVTALNNAAATTNVFTNIDSVAIV